MVMVIILDINLQFTIILHLLRDNYGPLKEVDLEFRVIQLSNLFRMVPYYLYEIHQKLLIYF